MSLRDALAFIAVARDDQALADRIDALGTGATLAQIVSMGAERGFAFTEDELRSAHRHDWGMRRVRANSENR